MDKAKYIVVDIGGLETPIVFPEHLNHADVARWVGAEVHSAGMVKSRGTVDCYGKSSSLNKEAAPMDADYLKRLLSIGDSEVDSDLLRKLEAIESQVTRLTEENKRLRERTCRK